MEKRYEIASSSSMPIITEHPVGRYVLASDYSDLQARLSAVEAERDQAERERKRSAVKWGSELAALAQREAALREALVEWIVDIAVFRQHVLAMMETGTRFYRPAIPLLLCQKTLALLGQSDLEHALSPHQPEGGQ